MLYFELTNDGTEIPEPYFESLLRYLIKWILNASYFQTFNATDTMLKNVDVWPTIKAVSFFESKLTFQIQHSIFRTKIREGEKTIFEVLKWYNEITTFILDYISVSIKDSDVSDFYRNVIAFKVIYFKGYWQLFGYDLICGTGLLEGPGQQFQYFFLLFFNSKA